jgi:aarF domain-containing kinase
MKMQSKMKEDIKDMMKTDTGFPEELIFLGRNMNLIRSINKYYGSKIDRVSIMVETAVRGTLTPDSKRTIIWLCRSKTTTVHVVG